MNYSQEPLLSWSAYIHPHHERGTTWYICALSFVISLFGYSVYVEAWSFSVIIVMTAALYWFMHRHTPEKRTMSIYDWGFTLDNRRVEWANCTGFWFLEGPGYHELHVEHNHKIIGDFVIQTGSTHLLEIHETLQQFIPELDERSERLLDTISRICKI